MKRSENNSLNHPNSAERHTANVVCLVLRNADGTKLATQRPGGKRLGGLWEFPGGKIEPGKPTENALRREIRDELDLKLGELHPVEPSQHHYDCGAIRLIPFLAERQGLSFSLIENADARWLWPDELTFVPWAPADIPIVEQLREAP